MGSVAAEPKSLVVEFREMTHPALVNLIKNRRYGDGKPVLDSDLILAKSVAAERRIKIT